MKRALWRPRGVRGLQALRATIAIALVLLGVVVGRLVASGDDGRDPNRRQARGQTTIRRGEAHPPIPGFPYVTVTATTPVTKLPSRPIPKAPTAPP